MTARIIFSLVLYRHSLGDILPLLRSIASLTASIDNQVFLVIYDASPYGFTIPCVGEIDDALPGVSLLHQKLKNIGFGSAHNFNFKQLSLSGEDLFIVVNPDIWFIAQELSPLLYWLQANSHHISCVSPLIFDESGEIQHSAKQNPTFLSLLIGRLSILSRLSFFAQYDSWHRNLREDYRTSCIDSPYLSGAFLVIPSYYYSKVNGFCPKYFLHLEDADIVRRLSLIGSTVHNPVGKVVHLWARGSHKSLFQTFHLLRSMFTYFSIWGFRLF